jgi:hypothetical protein
MTGDKEQRRKTGDLGRETRQGHHIRQGWEKETKERVILGASGVPR